MIQVGRWVIVYLGNPREKYWGRLQNLDQVGAFLRGMDLHMMEDWARELARGEETTMGLSSIFLPLGRIEKIFLDEDAGAARSMCTTFHQIVGRSVDEYLD